MEQDQVGLGIKSRVELEDAAEWTCFSHANVEDDDVLAVVEDVGLLEPQHREVGAFSDGLWHSTLWNRSKMMALSPLSMV
jgi:hypothetical protein